MSKFSDNLFSLRKENNLSQEDMSNLLHISRTGYGKYEQGNVEPTIQNLIKLANFFKVTVDFLIGNNKDSNSDIEEVIIGKRLDKNIKEVSQNVIEEFLLRNEKELKKLIVNELRGNKHE